VTIPATRSAGAVLGEHTTLVVRCVDRLYLNLYQPRLQYEGGVVGFFRERGFPIASSALMAPISAGFVRDVHRFIRQGRVPLVDFKARERKDDVMARFLAGHDGSEGILFVGRAQEKCRVFRTEKRVNTATGKSYPWLVRATAVVNHFYFYGFDDDFGPFFIKFCSYFPYGGRVYVNGHHYAQRQAAKAGIGYEALDNGFASCDDPDGLQRICDGLSAERIDAFVRKWLAVLPHPYTSADRAAGFRYDLSVLQAEFSVTAVVDRPRWGRVFFDQVIAENLTIGRPEQISIIFDRLVRARGRNLNRPGIRGGSLPWKRGWSYGIAADVWEADDASVFAGGEGAGGAAGASARGGARDEAGDGEAGRGPVGLWGGVGAFVGAAGRDRRW
jgi:hypothetical protein